MIDLTGVKIGIIKVESFSHSDNGAYWNCVCECGKRFTRSGGVIRKAVKNNFKNASCGCLSGNQSIEKSKAKLKGCTTYAPESPCGICGTKERYVSGPCVKCCKDRFERDRDQRLEKLKLWGDKNKEKLKEARKRHVNKNREKINERERKRRDRDEYRLKRAAYQRIRKHKLRAGGDLSKTCVEEINVEQKGLCNICKIELEKSGKHIDHIVPISRGGKNTKSNCQLLCPTCNLKKGNKLMEEL